MKYLYQCSKCQATFDDYDKCQEHERSHTDLNISATSYDMQQFNEYSPKYDVPEVIMMGYFDYTKESGYGIPVLFKYKLVGEAKEASKLYYKQQTAERIKYKQEQDERDAKLKGMIEELTKYQVEIPEESRDSYYQVKQIYFAKFGYDIEM